MEIEVSFKKEEKEEEMSEHERRAAYRLHCQRLKNTTIGFVILGIFIIFAAFKWPEEVGQVFPSNQHRTAQKERCMSTYKLRGLSETPKYCDKYLAEKN